MNAARDLMPDDLARQNLFQIMTRIGFVARGLLYMLIAVLVIATGRTADLTGAMRFLSNGAGRWLLALIAAGMAAYGLWRLADAAFGMEAGRHSWRSLRARSASAGVGFLYLLIAAKAARLLLWGQVAGIDLARPADRVLDLPGGSLLLGAAAIALIIAAIVQAVIAFRCSFLLPLNADALSTPVKWLGRLGYAARAVIMLLVAYLVGRAAIDGRSAEAGGMKQALAWLSSPLLYAVAIGLLLFGLFGLVEARHRRVRRPPLDKLRHAIGAALSSGS